MEKVLPSDLETPVSAFMKVRRAFPDEPAFLFESVERGEQVGRFSILGFHPEVMVRWSAADGGNPLTLLRKALDDFTAKLDVPLPFPGGSFGYLSYDAVRAFERIPGPKQPPRFPDAYFIVPKRMILFDHVKNAMTLFVIEKKEECEDAFRRMEEALLSPLDLYPVRREPAGGDAQFQSSETKESYMEKVEKAKEHIRAGDIFQVVLSQKFRGKTSAKPIDIYRALRILNPSPYMFFIDFNGFQIVGSSPEMLVKVKSGVAETKPIAGTRRRGKSEGEDQELAIQLLNDPKERAEHVMLVDLGRNDLGRVCRYGSVHLKGYMEIERYSHVMHLVSTVQGEIDGGKSPLDVLQSAFPAGTVTGAPKVRGMEIIEELEAAPRGPYAGSVGYVSFAGDVDTCITIRTIVTEGENVWLQAGAGIVADSRPEMEYQETLDKVEGMRQAIRLAENGLRLKP